MLGRLAWFSVGSCLALAGVSCGKPSLAGSVGAPAMRLTVSIDGAGAGQVQSTPAGIDCPGACTATFPAGFAVSLSAIPAQGSSFRGWSGACSGVGTCQIAGSATLTAAFGPTESASLSLVAVSAALPTLRLDSNPLRVFIRQWIKFEARSGGVRVPKVTWSVREGSTGGSVAGDGTYSAPRDVGLYHVSAAGVDDPGLQGSVAVEVVATQDLYDYGGRILPRPKVQLIWWGSAGEFLGAVERFNGFLDSVNGSAWLRVLDQYLRGESAELSRAGEIFDTTPHPTGSIPAPDALICGVLAKHGLEPDPGTIYALMVATATGKFDYHSSATCGGKVVPMIVLALPSGTEVRNGACSPTLTPAESMLLAFSHELAETMTDPQPASGWTDIYGQEIADDCAQATCAPLANGSYSLTTLLSNAAQRCAP